MKKYLSPSLCLLALGGLILFSRQAAESAREALSVCFGLILPTLFPFFVISVLMSRVGLPLYLGRLFAPAAKKLFRVSGAGASALFVGLCGGYPMGAAYIGDMLISGSIDGQEAEHLLAFCNNSGPAFIISAVGVGVFSSPAAGVFLYCIHIAAAVLSGVLLRSYGCGGTAAKKVHIESMDFFTALPEAVRQSVQSVLNVCGFVVCFSVLTGLLDSSGRLTALTKMLSLRTGIEQQWFKALFCGMLELGSGAAALRSLPLTTSTLALAAGILGWGGFSVHFQTLSVISQSGAKGALHIAGRLLSAGISALLALLLGNLFSF